MTTISPEPRDVVDVFAASSVGHAASGRDRGDSRRAQIARTHEAGRDRIHRPRRLHAESVLRRGHLFLSGVDPKLLAQLRKTMRVDFRNTVTAIPASETIMQSTLNAYDQAEEWLARKAVQ